MRNARANVGRAALLVGTVLLVGGCSLAHVEIDLARVRVDVDAGNSAWIGAFRAQDATALAGCFTRQGALLRGNGEVTRGREAIKKHMASVMSSLGPTETTIESGKIWPVEDGVYETGSYTYTFTPKDGERTTVGGKYVVLWQREQDGVWRIAMDLGLPDH